MIFPDTNIKHIFGYRSRIVPKGILVSFLWESIKIVFPFENIRSIRRTTYSGGKISWNMIRWGKCPPGREGLNIQLKKGIFKNHLIVFRDMEAVIDEINRPKFGLQKN
jgi:hypothetical protein